MHFNYMYVRPAKIGDGYDVIGVSTYEASSVLAGQDRIVFVDSYDTVEECEANHPECKGSYHNHFTAPSNTYDHLRNDEDEDEDDD